MIEIIIARVEPGLNVMNIGVKSSLRATESATLQNQDPIALVIEDITGRGGGMADTEDLKVFLFPSIGRA